MFETGTPYAKRERLCKNELTVITPECIERYLPLDSELLRPLAETGIRFAGYGSEAPGYHVKRNNPCWHTIVYTVEGSAEIRTSDINERVYGDTLYIAPAHIPHDYHSGEAGWRMIWFCFAPANSLGFAPDRPAIIPVSHNRLLYSICEELIISSGSGAMIDSALTGSTLQLLLQILRKNTEAVHQNIAGERQKSLDALFAAVRRNPEYKWTTESLLVTCSFTIGPDRFRQLCNEHFGCSPMKYVRLIRMQEAKQLLLATDYPLRVIAPMVGYSDEFSFSNAFNDVEGTSPDSFRHSN